MSNKWKQEEIKFIEENYLTMSDLEISNYLGTHSKQSVETKRRRLGLLNPNPYNKKYSFQDVLDEFSRTDYILLSDENDYINSAANSLKYMCPRHMDKGILKISLNHLQRGRGCYYCGRERTINARKKELDKDYDKKLCESHDFEYIDTIRKDGKITIEFICNHHRDLGNQYMPKYNMERNINGCKYCCGKELPEWYVLNKAKEINPDIELLEPYINMTTRMNCFCKKHSCETRKTMQEILKGQGCYYCGIEKLSEFHFLTDEEVQDGINKMNPHVKLIKYNGHGRQSEFYCTRHNKYFNKYYSTLQNCLSGCDECYTENIRERQGMGLEEFKKRLNEVHPELIVTGEYINNSTPISVYCTKHDYEYSLTPISLLDRITCCDKSRVTFKEECVCNLLEEKWNFNISRQKVFEDCIDKRALPFDIYLDDFNILIEYQGEQHYRPVRYSSESWEEATEKFEYTKKHDNIKKEYCKKNHIPLIEIPYWEFDDLEYFLFDKLVKLNVIEEIKCTA